MSYGLRFKERLRSGELVVGTWVMGARSPSLIGLIAASGFDFVLIDTQHAALSEETLADMCELSVVLQLPAIVRLPTVTAAAVNRILDFGATGVMCPDCRAISTVEEALRGSRFPPEGQRSAMSVPPSAGYPVRLESAHLEAMEAAALLAVQIESKEGVSSVADLAAAEGVDVIDIGRGDLAIDFGDIVATGSQTILSVVDDVVESARSRGVAVGTTCGSVDEALAMIERGVTFISYASDRRLLASAYRSALDELRERRPT